MHTPQDYNYHHLNEDNVWILGLITDLPHMNSQSFPLNLLILFKLVLSCIYNLSEDHFVFKLTSSDAEGPLQTYIDNDNEQIASTSSMPH